MIAYLFPGQGSHAVGMGQAAYATSPGAKSAFDRADEILGFSLSTLCFEGPLEVLTVTSNQQIALYVTSIAMLTAMHETEGAYPEPSFLSGHSLGEFSALTAAGSLDFEDGVRLVRKRGELMKAAGELVPGGMVAILGLGVDVVDAVCKEISQTGVGDVQIANDNCPGQIVISGHKTAVDAAAQALTDAKARKVVSLPVPVAAHSSLMKPAAEEFAILVDEVNLQPPTIPVIGNTTAAPLNTVADIKAELKAQLSGAVRWTESMQYLVAQGLDTIYEVGSGEVLQKLMKRIDRGVARNSVRLE